MPTQIERMHEALRTEFTTTAGVTYQSTLPKQAQADSVVVAPGDPYIQNGTHGAVIETWEVLVVVPMKDTESGLETMRKLSLRVRDAVSKVGASWQEASGPRALQRSAQQKQLVLSVNRVQFKYDPSEVTT